jgi:hypothetical protein
MRAHEVLRLHWIFPQVSGSANATAAKHLAAKK